MLSNLGKRLIILVRSTEDEPKLGVDAAEMVAPKRLIPSDAISYTSQQPCDVVDSASVISSPKQEEKPHPPKLVFEARSKSARDDELAPNLKRATPPPRLSARNIKGAVTFRQLACSNRPDPICLASGGS